MHTYTHTHTKSQDLLYPVNPTTDVEITTAVTLEELTGVWLLRTSIMATNGVTLELKGTAADGDCDEVKYNLRSFSV